MSLNLKQTQHCKCSVQNNADTKSTIHNQNTTIQTTHAYVVHIYKKNLQGSKNDITKHYNYAN